MIKTVFTVLFLAALSVGHPGPNSPPVHPAVLAARQDNSTTNGTTVNSTTGSNTTTDNNSTVISGETLPVLKVAKCECPEVFCDPRQNAKSLCQCQAQAQMACFLNSTLAGPNTEGACPKPADNAC